MARHAFQKSARPAHYMARHADPERPPRQEKARRPERRARLAMLGAVALLATGALISGTASPAEAPTQASRAVAVQPAIQQVPLAEDPKTAPKPVVPETDEFGRAPCPAPQPELVKKYLTTGHLATKKNLPRFNTGDAIVKINQTRSKSRILKLANGALKGSMEMHMATQDDYLAPEHNAVDTDQPVPTNLSDVSLNDLRATVTGVLQGVDGMPTAAADIKGQTHVVLTNKLKPARDEKLPHKLAGDYYGDQRKVALTLQPIAADVTITLAHELFGHGLYQDGAGTPNKVDCYVDAALRMPNFLTGYAFGKGDPAREQDPGTQEAEADAALIGLGYDTSDESPRARKDWRNLYNLSVMDARLAAVSPLGEQLADEMHDLFVDGYQVTQSQLALAG